MKNRDLFTALLVGLLVLTACAQPTTLQEAPAPEAIQEQPAAEAPPAAAQPLPAIIPRFINHPQPETFTNLAAFTFGGCAETSGLCPPDSPVGQLGCQKVVARDLAGGLTPPIPVAWCLVEVGQPANLQVFQYVPDPNPHYRSIIVYNEGQYYLVSDPASLQALYAPIETPAEAFSLSLLLTDAEPRYEQGIVPGAQYLVGTIEDTHISRYRDDYQVNLFSSDQTSACERTTYQDILRINQQGQVIIVSKEALYIEDICP